MIKLMLPDENGQVYNYQTSEPKFYPKPTSPLKSRVVYSAAHVVCDPFIDNSPMEEAAIDWEGTLNYRRYLWSLGLGVAEAMDTAQRGMGLGWNNTRELITRSLQEAKSVRGGIACGAGTDQLQNISRITLSQVKEAYLEQCEFIEKYEGQVILMASRALAACATSPDDYYDVYSDILKQVKKPVILHWLGEAFDPSLSGYWGYKNLNSAMEVCLNVIRDNKEKVDGIKISLLDAQREIEMRRILPKGVKMYTGDDFNYPELIQGDETGYSHALLGIFDAIAPAASTAIQALDRGNKQEYRAILDSTLPLSRHIFQAPTYYYKTGIVFLAYLNGHQKHFRMLGGLESARSVPHLAKLFVLADQAGLLMDPEFAVYRMNSFLNLAGVSNSV
ncbi:dihydrodipicolinate synthase family protein [Bacillus sp. 1780r2a1]|uniref:dihydrodipicolinate synthase family protein n=1 Tax=Priestia flexa TaxID=86664 RepID=UPI001B32C143|nr:dihydrodipicolinate synthase family protein [Priestia flexa]USY54946.1 dihydrodipicolinate synthase family protein [Bacillus sp. 1780r2a1]